MSTNTRTSTRMSGYHPMTGLEALRACRSGLRPRCSSRLRRPVEATLKGGWGAGPEGHWNTWWFTDGADVPPGRRPRHGASRDFLSVLSRAANVQYMNLFQILPMLVNPPGAVAERQSRAMLTQPRRRCGSPAGTKPRAPEFHCLGLHTRQYAIQIQTDTARTTGISSLRDEGPGAVADPGQAEKGRHLDEFGHRAGEFVRSCRKSLIGKPVFRVPRGRVRRCCIAGSRG